MDLFLDIGNEILEICERNAEANKLLYSHQTHKSIEQNVIRVRQLDWMEEKLSTGDVKSFLPKNGF